MFSKSDAALLVQLRVSKKHHVLAVMTPEPR
jgi:hypothetical protein